MSGEIDFRYDKADRATTAKAVELLQKDASRDLLGSLPVKLAAPVEKTCSRQSKSYLETAVDAGSSRLISNVETRDKVNRLGADFIKTTSLFARGKLGIAGTFIAYGLDQASPDESLKAQAADFALGGTKGATMKGMFAAIGTSGAFAPVNGAFMGMGAGAADEIFKRETFMDPSSLNDRLRRTAFNPKSVLMNAAVFTAGEGLYVGINHASRGALAENPLLSGMVMGGSFGFVNGSTQEAARELQGKGSFHPGKVLMNGLLDGGVQAAAAGTGITISDPVFQLKVKNTAANALESVGLNPFPEGAEGFPRARNLDLRQLTLSEPELEKICARVSRNFTPFEKMTEKYQKVSENLKAEGLKDPPSAAELAALEIYSNGDYSRINPVLRGSKVDLLSRMLYPLGVGPGVSMEGVTMLSASALNKLESFRGTVYRESTLYGDQIALYEPGKTVKELAFTSTSSETQGAAQRRGNTLFVITSKTGKAIDRFSRHPGEKEILFAPGTEYNVLSREPSTINGKPMTLIRMDEAK